MALHESADRRAADVCGKPYSLDRHLQNLEDAVCAADSRAGGWATAGTPENPDLLVVTGDGACVSGRFSAVRLSIFPGSTEYLNQSSSDVADLLLYLENSGAEHYLTLKARLANLQPQLRRIYKDGRLRPHGRREPQPAAPRHKELVLSADKPFIRHICGKLSHNADSFGAPFCSCTDEKLYDSSLSTTSSPSTPPTTDCARGAAI